MCVCVCLFIFWCVCVCVSLFSLCVRVFCHFLSALSFVICKRVCLFFVFVFVSILSACLFSFLFVLV